MWMEDCGGKKGASHQNSFSPAAEVSTNAYQTTAVMLYTAGVNHLRIKTPSSLHAEKTLGTETVERMKLRRRVITTIFTKELNLFGPKSRITHTIQFNL
jgi:hypothetical protein